MASSAATARRPRPAPRTQVRLWDGRWWPCAGRYAAAPVFRYGWAPSGLATVRQLAAKGLRPAGQDVAGWLVWGPANRPRWAYLYRLDLAAPKRAMTPARWAAIERATPPSGCARPAGATTATASPARWGSAGPAPPCATHRHDDSRHETRR